MSHITKQTKAITGNDALMMRRAIHPHAEKAAVLYYVVADLVSRNSAVRSKVLVIVPCISLAAINKAVAYSLDGAWACTSFTVMP